jgi:hypothetical protein
LADNRARSSGLGLSAYRNGYEYVSYGFTQPARRLRQVLAHHARKRETVRTPLLQTRSEVRGMSLPVRLGQVHRNRDGKRAGMPPDPPPGHATELCDTYTKGAQGAIRPGRGSAAEVSAAGDIEMHTDGPAPLAASFSHW